MSVRVRYSPSPSGAQHLGSARTALFNWLFARRHGGAFVLRVEDTDQSRSSEAAVRDLCETLRWLGLDWDEGPEVGGPYGPYNQMARLDLYAQALVRLRASGAVYPCYCTPEELARRRQEAQARGQPPRYDGRCRRLSAAERAARQAAERRPAWRIAAPQDGETVVHDLVRGDVAYPNDSLDDFVVVRSDGVPTYNFAVVVDDLAMRITHVLRGDEHLANTPKQLLLYAALGAPPPAFGHLPMILAADRTKLSKRHGSIAVQDFRQAGILPEALINYCALLGWSPPDGREVLDREELVAAFSLDRVNRSPAVYDVEKLRWLNGQHLRRLSPAELVRRARPWLERAGLPAGDAGAAPQLEAVVALVRERVPTLADLPPAIEYFYRRPEAYDAAGVRRHFGAGAAERLRAAAEAVRALADFSEASLEAAYRALAERLGVRAAELIHSTRLALTGRTVGPSLFALAALLGREECAARLEAAAARIAQGA